MIFLQHKMRNEDYLVIKKIYAVKQIARNNKLKRQSNAVKS